MIPALFREVFLGKELAATVELLASVILVLLRNAVGEVVLKQRMNTQT